MQRDRTVTIRLCRRCELSSGADMCAPCAFKAYPLGPESPWGPRQASDPVLKLASFMYERDPFRRLCRGTVTMIVAYATDAALISVALAESEADEMTAAAQALRSLAGHRIHEYGDNFTSLSVDLLPLLRAVRAES